MMASKTVRLFTVVLLLLSGVTSQNLSRILQQNNGDCSASSPCEFGCCGPHGWCGFGPDFCGDDCVGTCDAVAECGQYALPENELCPLNVCCSGDGFCGTTTLFCDDGCQNGCDAPSRPSCGSGSGTSNAKTIGYYESWSYNRPGCAWTPEDLNVELLTHINYAFALVGPDYRISAMNSFDPMLYTRTIALKAQNPSLKVSIAVGGWAASGPPFSNMARTAANRAVFIQSVLDLLDTYGFDGIDLDWEYPVSPDRDGADVDKENYVHLVRELRQALPPQKEISVAIPASLWYLQHFDVTAMAEHIDWFNMMTYDIHGTWDGDSDWTQPVVQPHTNLSEIDDGLNLLWRSHIDPSQVVLGLAFYGRSFALSDPSCTEPMCGFSGGAEPGFCMDTSGVLSNWEIRRVLDRTGVEPVLDRQAGIKYISWEGQWVSYDDGETLALKKQFANERCLAGTMIWALDLDEPGSPTLRALAGESLGGGGNGGVGFPGFPDWPGIGADQALNVRLRIVRQVQAQNEAAMSGLLSPCTFDPQCPVGWHTIIGASGVWSLTGLYTADECPVVEGWHRLRHMPMRAKRWLCVPDNVMLMGCRWVGRPLRCDQALPRGNSVGGCPRGTILIAHNNMPPESTDDGMPDVCYPGTQSSLCCGSATITDTREWCDDYDYGGILLSGGAAGAVGQNAASDRVRRRVRRLSGDRSDYNAGFGGNWGDNQGCNNQRIGWHDGVAPGFLPHNVPMNSLWTVFPDVTTSAASCTTTITWTTTSTTTTTETRTCDPEDNPQACFNYYSVAKHMRHNPAWPQSNVLLCPWHYRERARWVPRSWNQQHSGWTRWNAKPRGTTCERDEYPFMRALGQNPEPNRPDQWIRLVPQWENGHGGNLIARVCPVDIETTVETVTNIGTSRTCFVTVRTTSTQVALSISYNPWSATWSDTAVFDDMLDNNPCLPEINFDDPGYALFTNDPWYRTGNGYLFPNPSRYRSAPALSVTQGYNLPRALPEDIFFDEDEGFGIVRNRNQSRRATPEELVEHLGILPCRSYNCVKEKAALGLDENGDPIPMTLDATITLDLPGGATADSESPSREHIGAPDLAAVTGGTTTEEAVMSEPTETP